MLFIKYVIKWENTIHIMFAWIKFDLACAAMAMVSKLLWPNWSKHEGHGYEIR